MKLEFCFDGAMLVDGVYVPESVRILELRGLMEEAKKANPEYREHLIHIDVLPKVTSIATKRENITAMKIGEEKLFSSTNPEEEIKVRRVSKNFVVAIALITEVLYNRPETMMETEKVLLCD